MPPEEQGLKRLCEIQQRITPFMQKLWIFNLTARKEIESAFDDDVAYLDMMKEKYSHIGNFFSELELRITLGSSRA